MKEIIFTLMMLLPDGSVKTANFETLEKCVEGGMYAMSAYQINGAACVRQELKWSMKRGNNEQ